MARLKLNDCKTCQGKTHLQIFFEEKFVKIRCYECGQDVTRPDKQDCIEAWNEAQT